MNEDRRQGIIKAAAVFGLNVESEAASFATKEVRENLHKPLLDVAVLEAVSQVRKNNFKDSGKASAKLYKKAKRSINNTSRNMKIDGIVRAIGGGVQIGMIGVGTGKLLYDYVTSHDIEQVDATANDMCTATLIAGGVTSAYTNTRMIGAVARKDMLTGKRRKILDQLAKDLNLSVSSLEFRLLCATATLQIYFIDARHDTISAAKWDKIFASIMSKFDPATPDDEISYTPLRDI